MYPITLYLPEIPWYRWTVVGVKVVS
jgi:hypothetical protein